jgi:hypothetical protein
VGHRDQGIEGEHDVTEARSDGAEGSGRGGVVARIQFGVSNAASTTSGARNRPIRERLENEVEVPAVAIVRNTPIAARFNEPPSLPYNLRIQDFEMAMRDVYDFFHDVNNFLVERGLQRLDDMLRPAIMSGLLSDMLTASLATHSRSLTQNKYHNGHPDLIVKGKYQNDS